MNGFEDAVAFLGLRSYVCVAAGWSLQCSGEGAEAVCKGVGCRVYVRVCLERNTVCMLNNKVGILLFCECAMLA